MFSGSTKSFWSVNRSIVAQVLKWISGLRDTSWNAKTVIALGIGQEAFSPKKTTTYLSALANSYQLICNYK